MDREVMIGLFLIIIGSIFMLSAAQNAQVITDVTIPAINDTIDTNNSTLITNTSVPINDSVNITLAQNKNSTTKPKHSC